MSEEHLEPAGHEPSPEAPGTTAARAPEHEQMEQEAERARVESERAKERAERTAERLRGLQRVTDALSRPLTRAQVAEVIAEQGLRVLGAEAGGISCLTREGHLGLVYSFGASQQPLHEYWRTRGAAHLPYFDVVRSRQPIWLESPEEIDARYPHLEDLRADLGIQAWAVVPLLADERPLGALGLRFSRARPFEPEDRGFILSLANACAQALERARLFEEQERLRREAESARSLLDTFLANVPVGLAFLDHDLRHVQINPALAETYGKPIEAQLGRMLHEVLPPAWREGAEQIEGLMRRVLETGQPVADWPVSGRLPSDSAPLRHWLKSLYPIRDRSGRVLGVGVVAVEVTRLEEARQEHEALLARERTARREAEAASRALDEANRQKDQFLAMLAHELRNPLAAIGNAVHLMRLRLARGQSVEEALAVLDRQVKNSSRLLDDLLDVARITRGMIQLRKEPVRLDVAVASAVEAQRALIQSKRQQLTLSLPGEPLIVRGDPTRLEQVAANLLHNATKYTPEGGQIALALERGQGEAILRVRDNGIGISAELLPRVFDLFVQAEKSLARTQGGLGLGLTLVRNLVTMHGGTVEARSEGVGKGSEFVVRLPMLAEVPEPAHQAPVAKAPPALALGRILVVEDNLDAAQLLSEVLIAAGHQVEVAHDGATAILKASRFKPEIALIDIGLPAMDGYEVARRLRAELQDRTPALVALTGYGQEEDRERSRGAGFSIHLTKPFDLELLQRLIQEILES